MNHLALSIIFTVLIFPAVFFVLIPMMPAFFYMFVMTMLYGLIENFKYLTGSELAVLAVIFCLSVVVDYTAGIIGAKYGGASKKSILYGIFGVIVGSILFPPFGGLPGLFIAVFVCELFLNKTRSQAFKAAKGSLLGVFTGIALNFVLALTFFSLFVFFIL